ncbi:hypothetical protein H4R18_003936 [Coemansia javaensis]|uniref:Uncharacterized protein n=1 Tax=Coemansia javaensis TaxID=2761396 RepID=A0A9W8H5N2_9FUNG|nr:hypothetical protein H4R18_003936 [Coemansia javaensis]
MHINDLPDDVLRLVLRWAVGVPDDILRLSLYWAFNYDVDVLHEFKHNLPLPAVEAAGFMRSVTSEWGGVKSLVLEFCPLSQPDDEADAAMEAACSAVAAAFPGVSGLCFCASISNSDAATIKLYGRLTGVYAGQLERLDTDHPVNFPPEVVFKRLKRLNVRHYYKLGDRLPRMDPDVLEVLNLDTWPQSQAWAAFGPDMTSREIRLSRLKALRFVQLEDFAEDMWRLHLPSLECLDVGATYNPHSLIELMMLPPRMTTIKICAGPPVLRAVARMALPAVQHLEIDIPYEADSDPTALPAANRILAGFLSVFVEDMQADVSVPGPDDADMVEPFDAKIKRLVVEDFRTILPEQLAAVVKYMVLRTPALTWLRVPLAIEDLVEVFVRAYTSRYPHLNYVERFFR